VALVTDLEAADRGEEDGRASARRGQISMAEANRLCQEAESREALVDVVLRYSRQTLQFV
jgi:hypothetical protein